MRLNEPKVYFISIKRLFGRRSAADALLHVNLAWSLQYHIEKLTLPIEL